MFKIDDNMTPLQALEAIKKVLSKYLSEKTGISEEKHFEYLQYDTEIGIVAKALTPPTSDEVCEAIENEIEWETEFKDNGFYFKNSEGYIVKLDDKGKLLYNLHPTPKTSSIISRFYEAQE